MGNRSTTAPAFAFHTDPNAHSAPNRTPPETRHRHQNEKKVPCERFFRTFLLKNPPTQARPGSTLPVKTEWPFIQTLCDFETIH